MQAFLGESLPRRWSWRRGAARRDWIEPAKQRFLCRPPPAYFIRSGSGGDVVFACSAGPISGSSMPREPIGASDNEVQDDAMDGRRKSEWGRPDSQCALGSMYFAGGPVRRRKVGPVARSSWWMPDQTKLTLSSYLSWAKGRYQCGTFTEAIHAPTPGCQRSRARVMKGSPFQI